MLHTPIFFFITALPTTWQVKGQVITAIKTTNATGTESAVLQADCVLCQKNFRQRNRTLQIRKKDILLHPDGRICNCHLLSHDATLTETAMEKGTSPYEVMLLGMNYT